MNFTCKRGYFEMLRSGKKTVDYREATDEYDRRLRGKEKIQFTHQARGCVRAAMLEMRIENVTRIDPASIDTAIAPAAGTAEHRDLFNGARELFAIELGAILNYREAGYAKVSTVSPRPPRV